MFANTLIYENDGQVNISEGIKYIDQTIRNYLYATKIKLSLAIIYIMDDNGEYEYAVREMKKIIEYHGSTITIFHLKPSHTSH